MFMLYLSFWWEYGTAGSGARQMMTGLEDMRDFKIAIERLKEPGKIYSMTQVIKEE